jgi:long-subunit acyl-CoA synthetase (AMP-forming)
MTQKLILDYVYDNEEKFADRVYMTQPTGGGQTVDYTWRQTLDAARRMATHLQSMGFEPGSKIAICSKNCAHFIMAELAIWMAGYTTVALYATMNADSVAYVLEHSEAKALFVGKLDTWDAIKPGVPADLPHIALPLAPKNDFPKWNDIIQTAEPMAGRPARAPEDISLMIYTSGSTGRPKGVMHCFGNTTKSTEGVVKTLEITSEERVLSYLPLAHVFERAYIQHTSLMAGSHVFFAESLDTFVADLQRAHPTVFISVPRLWLKFQLGVFKKMPKKRLDFLLKIPVIRGIIKKKLLSGLGLDATRLAGSGSAPIPAELIAWYRSLGLNLMEGYAMSEDFAYSHLSTEQFSEPGYVGVPYEGVDVKLSDEGEILIKSWGAMVGYYKQDELTKESFTEDGYFKTGDRGERKPSGLLKITGRVKEIFKTSKGKYVAPAPIENLINNDEHVELSCVSGSGQPKAYAQVVLNEDLRATMQSADTRTKVTAALDALLKKVNAAVEHHEELQFIAVVSDTWTIENHMLTPTMKIKRQAIEKASESNMEKWYDEGKSIVWM